MTGLCHFMGLGDATVKASATVVWYFPLATRGRCWQTEGCNVKIPKPHWHNAHNVYSDKPLRNGRLLRRNTPTGVGKTLPNRQLVDIHWKHPHGRGEDLSSVVTSVAVVETPPRAWGRPSQAVKTGSNPGNTPTGVGKTSSSGLASPYG